MDRHLLPNASSGWPVALRARVTLLDNRARAIRIRTLTVRGVAT